MKEEWKVESVCATTGNGGGEMAMAMVKFKRGEDENAMETGHGSTLNGAVFKAIARFMDLSNKVEMFSCCTKEEKDEEGRLAKAEVVLLSGNSRFRGEGEYKGEVAMAIAKAFVVALNGVLAAKSAAEQARSA